MFNVARILTRWIESRPRTNAKNPGKPRLFACLKFELNISSNVATATELIEHFQLLSCPDLSPRFNIAPTSQIPIIRWKQVFGRIRLVCTRGLLPSGSKESVARAARYLGGAVLLDDCLELHR